MLYNSQKVANCRNAVRAVADTVRNLLISEEHCCGRQCPGVLIKVNRRKRVQVRLAYIGMTGFCIRKTWHTDNEVRVDAPPATASGFWAHGYSGLSASVGIPISNSCKNTISSGHSGPSYPGRIHLYWHLEKFYPVSVPG